MAKRPRLLGSIVVAAACGGGSATGASAHADAARWTKFMAEVLVPKTAALLHKTPFNPADGSGEFSCEGCHTMVTVEPAVAPVEHTAPAGTP